MNRTLMVGLISLVFASSALALPGTVPYTAIWNANTESDLSGYYVYWRSATTPYNNINRVQVLSPQKILTGVVPNNSYISVTAFDKAGNESGFSNEIFFSADLLAPANPIGLKVE